MIARKNITLRQLSFPFKPAGPSLERRLADKLGSEVKIIYTDNRRTMVSSRRTTGKTLVVRLHHMFREADGKTLQAVADYLKDRDRKSSEALSAFIRDNDEMIRRSPRSARPGIETKGQFHDLAQLCEKVNREYFDAKLTCAITWGQRTRRRGRRHIRLGSYSFELDLIRIHPALDREWVPQYYVESVIHHEMLHAQMGVKNREGRCRYHTKDFRNGERTFKHHDRALAWEKKHISRLI